MTIGRCFAVVAIMAAGTLGAAAMPRAVMQRGRIQETELTMGQWRAIAAAAPANPLDDPLMIRSIDWGKMHVAVEGRLVAVSGRVRIDDRVPSPHIWRLRVYAASKPTGPRGPLLREHYYRGWPRGLEPGQTEMHPTFQYQFALPRGRYHIELSIDTELGYERWRRTQELEPQKKKCGGSNARIEVR
jgi:hypothetical protein